MIALSPIFILSVTIVILIFLICYIKLDTKNCMIFTVGSLVCALILSCTIGYQVATHPSYASDKSNDTQSITTDSTAQNNESSQEKSQKTEIGNKNNNESKTVTSKTKDSSTDKTTNNSSKAGSPSNTVSGNEAKNDSGAALSDETDLDSNTVTTDSEKPLMQPNAESDWQAAYITPLFTSDGYGLLYISLILLIAIIVSCFGYEWFKQEQPQHGFFYVILLFTTLGGITLVYASHLLSFYLGIEFLSLSFIGLIGYQYMQHHSLEAAIKYMILSSVASAFLLMGIAFYYAATGELTFSGLSYKFSTLSYPSTLLSMGACLMLVGIGFKVSLVPFQLWLPDVYQGTPTPVLLMFSTIGKVAVFCAIAKLFLFAPIVNNDTLHAILVFMAFFSILWGNFLALRQKNVKRLLAYSSISHFGYLMTALIAVQYQVLALETIGVYLISYILANISLLGGINLESHSTDPQDHENEVDLYGLFWRRPIIAIAMSLSLLSLAGVPLTSGFISRFMLILLGVTAELWWIIAAIVVGSALGLYFYARLIIHLYIKPKVAKRKKALLEPEVAEIEVNIPRLTTKLKNVTLSEIFIVLAAFLTLLCGIYPKWLFSLVNMAQYLTT